MKKGKVPFKVIGEDIFSFLPGMNNAQKIPILYADTLEESSFRTNWVNKNKPCLIKGAVKHWPAVQKWRKKEFWINSCPNFEVRVFPHRNYNNSEKQNLNSQSFSFHKAISKLYSEEDKIFSIPGENIANESTLSELKKDLKGFSFISSLSRPRYYFQRRIFLYRGAATAWHYHSVDETLMCQVNGSKMTVLLPPETPNIEYVSNFLTNELQLEGHKFDPLIKIKPFATIVEEGDALYIPPYWYHGVAPTDMNVGFTLAHCWRSPIHKLGDFSNFFVRRLYKSILWPPNKKTLLFPFIGLYAFMHFMYQKITG